MLISGGKVIAIDSVNTSTATLSGDGVWQELGLNTSAVIDPINNKISAISSKLDNEIATRTSADNVLSAGIDYVSGVASSNSSKIDYLSGAIDSTNEKITVLSSTVDTISSKVDSISSKVDTISGKLDKEIQDRISGFNYLYEELDAESYTREEDDQIISAALVQEIQNRISADSALSAAIDKEKEERITADDLLTNNINTLSASLENEIEERKENDEILSAYCDELSANLDAETDIRAEVDEILSAAIDTKQHRLSAGDYIEIVSGDDYDTISVTGLKTFTYFSTPYGRHTSTEYFTFDGTKLSANSAIGYFNLAINYKVHAENVCVDNYYSAGFSVNQINVDTHYINGGIPFETHTFSKNVLNDAENNLYEIGFNKDTGIDVNDISITCVGFMGEPDQISIGVLGANGGILTFGNNILRV